jgi:polyphosphate kinase
MLPIEDERLKRRIVDEILAVELADNTKATALEPDGTYRRLHPKGDKDKVRAQQELIERARKRAGTQKKKKKKKDKEKDGKKRDEVD